MKEFFKIMKFGRIFRLKLKNNIRFWYLILNNYKFGIKVLEFGWLDFV